MAVAVLLARAADADEILVFAAASLTDALKAIATPYEAQTHDHLTFSFGSSTDLARQIAAGAPADVFFSADAAKVDGLQNAGLVRAADRVDVLSNALAVIVPSDASTKITKPADLLAVQHLALADPETVPAGVYARQYLTAHGLWDQLKDRVVPTADVRAALAAVQGAHAEAGIVYRTDAAIAPGVRIAYDVPRDQGPAITYVLAPTAAASSKPAVQHLVKHLAGDEAGAVYRKLGFVVLTGR